MDFIYYAVLLHVLFNAMKSAESDYEDIIAMAGCNISLTWILPSTGEDLVEFNIGSSYERPIATLSSDQQCHVQDNSRMLCSINCTDDGLIIVLNIFNVTAGQSGNYIIWRKTLLPEHSSNIFKNLVVIGMPAIMEVRKPILGLPFQMTCNTTYEQGHYLYRWKINDIENTTVYNGNSHTISSLGMNDNFSNVTCQICLDEKASNSSSVTCENGGCSIESNPYTIHVLYGPDNVSFSREERHFYLKEHDIFAIECFANCYPSCLFWWKGRDTIESQKLNIIFESGMAGQYACHVTNQQTNITLISDPITLHHVKEDFQRENNWLGTVTVCVFVLIAGLLIVVTIWRTNTTRTMDSGKLSQVRVQQTQTDVSLIGLERHKRHMHIPSNKGRECKRTRRLECPNKSTEDNFRPSHLENHYNSIDDDVLSDDNLGMDLLIHKTAHEPRRNTEHINYDYAHSLGIYHVETAFMHVADESSLTPSNDIARPVEIFLDEGNEVPDTDHSYLTVIDDSVHSMDMCQVEETDVNDVDQTTISPLNG